MLFTTRNGNWASGKCNNQDFRSSARRSGNYTRVCENVNLHLGAYEASKQLKIQIILCSCSALVIAGLP